MDFLKRMFGLGGAAQQDAEPNMIGWVVLSDTDVELTVDSVRVTLDALYPGQFLPANDRNFRHRGRRSRLAIHDPVECCRCSGNVHAPPPFPAPTPQFSDFAEAITDPGLRALAVSQQAWLAVDAMHVHTTEAEAYRLIGAVLAKLAPPDAAVLVHPSKSIVMRFDSDVRSRLASGLQPT